MVCISMRLLNLCAHVVTRTLIINLRAQKIQSGKYSTGNRPILVEQRESTFYSNNSFRDLHFRRLTLFIKFYVSTGNSSKKSCARKQQLFSILLVSKTMYRGGRGFQGNKSKSPQTEVEVNILGWNGSTPGECINFIARKCKITVTNYSVDNQSGILKGKVSSEQQANNLLQWSGVRFAGQPLKITRASSSGMGLNPQNNSGESAMDTLKAFLKSRYNPEIKLLNLSGVQQDQTLVSRGYFGTASTSSKIFPALMTVAGELGLEVHSADLSNNNLNDLSNVSTLAQAFPNLINLSLQNNNIARLKTFDVWKKKLCFLRELIVIGNPFLSNANSNDAMNTKQELMKCFPRLVVLNGEVVRNEQVLNSFLKFAFDLPQSMFFQDSEVQSISAGFASNFINLWDTDRAGIMGLYQNESQFSLQVDSSLPHNTDNHADFGYYLSQSRNLTKVLSVKAKEGKVHVGPNLIFKAFMQLPSSRHDLMTKPENYSMEAYRLPQMGAICITMHGSFTETDAPKSTDNSGQHGRSRNGHGRKSKFVLGTKSFDRTFIVIPGPNNSMIVASDLMCVRGQADPEVFKTKALVASASAPAPTPVPNALNTPLPHTMVPGSASQINPQPPSNPGSLGATPDLPMEIKSQLNAPQQELLVRVLLETKLTIQYGLMLCEQSNWDYQLCTVNFKNSAASLPKEAFST